MKLIKKLFLPLLLAFSLIGCGSSADEVDPLRPIFTPQDTTTMTETQKYVQNYFGKKFNVDIRYKYEDRLASNQYKLGPTEEAKALRYLNLIRYTFFEVYEKVAPKHFAEKHTIKLLVLFGTLGYGPSQDLLGEAPQGMILAYDINNLEIPWFDVPNRVWSDYTAAYKKVRDKYISTLYHESAHTLHQETPIPSEYLKLSISHYKQDNAFIYWADRGISPLLAGFVTDYASKSPEEDFAELYGMYMILLPHEWEAMLQEADHKLSSDEPLTGRQIIERKLAIMKTYLRNNYSLDIDVIRREANLRMSTMTKVDDPNYYDLVKADFSLLPPSYYDTVPHDY